MKNVRAEISGNHLVITIDVSSKARKQAQASSTGKTKLLATTSGFVVVKDVRLSLNATIEN